MTSRSGRRFAAVSGVWAVLAIGLGSGELFAQVGQAAARVEDGWSNFRGPRGDGSVDLGGKWGDGATLTPRFVQPLGSGYSGVVGVGGVLATAWSAEGSDWVGTFDATSGALRWRQSLGPTYLGHDGSHDGPVATPAIAADTVVSFSPRGVLAAYALADGKSLWQVDLSLETGVAVPLYGFGSSPLVSAGTVIVEATVAGSQAVAGFDLVTGARRWQVGDETVEYQSPIAATLAGQPQVLVAGAKRLWGLEPQSGAVLWSYEHGGDEDAMAADVPLPIEGDRILLTRAFDERQLLHVERKQGDPTAGQSAWSVRQVWSSKALGRTYGPPVYHQGTIYGYVGTTLTAVDAATGERRWRSRAPGDGFLALADDQLVVLTKRGALHLAAASPIGYRETAKLQLFDGYTWTPPSIVAGQIVARSLGQLASVGVEAAAGQAGVAVSAPPPPGGLLPDASSGFGRFLAELEALPAVDRPARIDGYLAAQSGFPLIDGDRVHVLYRGAGEDLGVISDAIGSRAQEAMARVAGTDLFHWSTQLPEDGLISYRLVVDFDTTTADPRNPLKSKERAGEVSWVAMPRWRAPDYFAEPVGGAPQGRFESHSVAIAAPAKAATAAVENTASSATAPTEAATPAAPSERKLDVWLPPGYDGGAQRYPVVYLHWGDVAATELELGKALDQLIGSGRLAPMIVVAVHRLDPTSFDELLDAAKDNYVASLVNDVVPFVDRSFRTVADPAHRASIGQGLGGYPAIYAALRGAPAFGVVAAQSAFMLTAEETALLAAIPSGAAASSLPRVHLEWSSLDGRAPHEGWDMRKANAALAETLRKRGFTVVTRVVNAAPGWFSFKSRLDLLLAPLFSEVRPAS